MNNEDMRLAQSWDLQNPEMEPIKVPADYKATYLYQLSALCETDDISAAFEDMGGWGVISLETDHILSRRDMDECQAGFEAEGVVCMSDLRLVKQTFKIKD